MATVTRLKAQTCDTAQRGVSLRPDKRGAQRAVNPEEGGLSYPVRGIDIGEGVLKQQRDLLFRLGVVEQRVALLVDKRRRI